MNRLDTRISFLTLLATLSLILTLPVWSDQRDLPGPAQQYLRTPFAAGWEYGWQPPYGMSLQASAKLFSAVEAYSALGFSLTGLRTGIGLRHYVVLGPVVSLHWGGAWAWNGGAATVNYGVYSSDEAVYGYHEDHIFSPRVGIGFHQPYMTTLVSLGWGFPVQNRAPFFVSGFDSNRGTAELFAPGGPELTLGMMFP